MKELGEGSRDMMPSQTGWDINPRVLGIVPKEAKVDSLKGFHWVLDAHYHVHPEGRRRRQARGAARPDELPADARRRRPTTYDDGYFYPGPAVKDVPLSMAPQESQKVIKEFGRPEYDAADRRQPAGTAAAAGQAGRRLPPLGRADRRAKEEVTARRGGAERPTMSAASARFPLAASGELIDHDYRCTRFPSSFGSTA